MMLSAITASFLIAGISAYRIYRGDKKRAPRLTLKIALAAAMILTPLQAFVGDLHGLNTLKHQPQKVAAMEGVWETEKGVPLLLFAIPDENTRSNHFEVAIPNLASLILTHDMDGEIKGLNEFEGKHPPVKPVFFAFRIMVGLGLLMMLVAWWCGLKVLRDKSLSTIQLKILIAMSFSGWVATLAGWYVTEIGRQPYLVSNVLTVEEAVTTIAPTNVVFSLVLYLVVYAFLLLAYLYTIFVMARRAVEIEEIPLESKENNIQTALTGDTHA